MNTLMEKLKKNLLKLGFFAILLILVGTSAPYYANAGSDGLPFFVKPILPENQDENIDHYISITTKKKSLNQVVEFLVTNRTNEKQIIDIEILNAYTSANGVIQYAAKESDNNKIINPKYEMKQYIEGPSQVELQAGQSKIIRFKVNIPDMDGTVLGGVAFKGEGDHEQTKTKGVSFEIRNEINTVYGIAVNFPISQKDYEFKFGKPFLDPMASYYAIRLPVTLDSPLLLKDVDINYEVEYKGEKLFFSKQKIDFAPMTETNFSIPFEAKEIKQNKPYTLKGEITYVDTNGKKQVKEFEQDFVYKVNDNQISNIVSNLLNVPAEKGEFSYLALLLLLLIILLLIFFFVIFWRRKKKEDDEKKNTDEITSLEKGGNTSV